MKSLRGKKGEDLIFAGSRSMSRLNRGSVTIAFDNTEKQFDLDFDEVIIERVVFRDGTNEYLINGSKVRLRDVIELLSQVSLGTSSHHIINQNEADRILGASPKERKEMVEDALGLRVFHWKIAESEKKLDKTRENIKEAKVARREISGHLRFLEKEAEKIERAEEMRKELFERLCVFIKKERASIKEEKESFAKEGSGPHSELVTLEKRIKELEGKRKPEEELVGESNDHNIQKELHSIRLKKDELSRALGKLEGMIEIKENEQESFKKKNETQKTFSYEEVSGFLTTIEDLIGASRSLATFDELKKVLTRIKETVTSFRDKDGDTHKELSQELREHLDKLVTEKKEIESEIESLSRKEDECERKQKEQEEHLSELRKNKMEEEREYFSLKEERARLSAQLETIKGKEALIARREEDISTFIGEAGVLLGVEKAEALREQKAGGETFSQEESATERKEIERIKIRIEELGGGNVATLSEFNEVKERDAFLEKEINDLEESEKSIQEVIAKLEDQLALEFKKGIQKINIQFQKYFEILFDGGKAALNLVQLTRFARGEELAEKKEAIEKEEGLDISVSLPRKKIRGLEMLSGGERALTSIALLFAMTQVKPPPFLVLDETDAALDEANSRKYGKMVAELAKHTQLILITHNRETMSNAGILYGVTMGNDGISKLLSVKLEDAVAIAK